MKHAVEIILTLSATFKGSADQQSVDAKTDFAFLGHDNLFSQIYMTQPEGQTQVIARAQSISLIRCLFRLVKCKIYWASVQISMVHIMLSSLLTYLIFSTHAQSVKWEGHNLIRKKKARKSRGCCGYCIPPRLCSSIARYCDSPSLRCSLVGLRYSLFGTNLFSWVYVQVGQSWSSVGL